MLRKAIFALKSRSAIECFWLYLVILIPTLVFKSHYLNRLVVGGTESLANDLLPGQHAILFYGVDFVEVLIFASLIYLVARNSPRRMAPILIIGATLLSFLIMIANWVSVKELATLLTPNSLVISLSWVTDNPEHIKSYIHGRRDMLEAALGAFGFVCLAGLPVIVASQFGNVALFRNVHPAVISVTAVLAASLSLSSYKVAAAFPGDTPMPLRGYWTSTVSSLFATNKSNLLALEVPEAMEMMESYRELVYPKPAQGPAEYPHALRTEEIRPRHILVISLETAPRAYYPIVNNEGLPAFHRMSQHAVTSLHHYANSPFTTRAIYSMLAGTYPNPGGSLPKYGNFQTDGLAEVLRQHGYDSTFIDSYKIDWILGMKTHEVMWRNLGFDTQSDNADNTELDALSTPYEKKVRREELSFEKAFNSIVGAEESGRKAAIFLGTLLGHYKWAAPPELEDTPGAVKIESIARHFDQIMGTLLNKLESHDLLDEVLILITGDHGLRYQNEFDSLDESMEDVNIAFNVPFMLYAPGLLESSIEIPYATSHVDITPTLLQLVGIDTEGMIHHGGNILDDALGNRVTFMMNTQLSSTDWFHWNGHFVAHNNLTGQSTVLTEGANTSQVKQMIRTRYGSIPSVFDQANQHFSRVAAYALSIGEKKKPGSTNQQSGIEPMCCQNVHTSAQRAQIKSCIQDQLFLRRREHIR